MNMNLQNSIFNQHTNQNATHFTDLQSQPQLWQEVMSLRAKNHALETKLTEKDRNISQLKKDMQVKDAKILKLEEQLAIFSNHPYSTQGSSSSTSYQVAAYQTSVTIVQAQQPIFWTQPQDNTSISCSTSNEMLEFFVADTTGQQTLALGKKTGQNQRVQASHATLPSTPQRQQCHKSTQYAVVIPCRKCAATQKTSTAARANVAVKKARRIIALRNKPKNTQKATVQILSAEPISIASVQPNDDPDYQPSITSSASESDEDSSGKVVNLSKKRLSSILSNSVKKLKRKQFSSNGENQESSMRNRPSGSKKPGSSVPESGDPERPFKCNYCEKTYKKKEAVRDHERTHTGEKPYACHFCEKTFGFRTGLVQHLRIHTDERPHKCRFCDSAFKVIGSLIEHERIHTGERPYQCTFCEKTYSRRTEFQFHVRTHTGERPYKCRFCPKSFHIHQKCKEHERSHTGEKPYKCEICGAGFTVINGLKKHRLAHSDEKPHKCTLCNASFKRKDHLTQHQRTHGASSSNKQQQRVQQEATSLNVPVFGQQPVVTTSAYGPFSSM